jgi:hypothetical protein
MIAKAEAPSPYDPCGLIDDLRIDYHHKQAPAMLHHLLRRLDAPEPVLFNPIRGRSQ